MIIELKKFGTTLVSRQFGKESFAAFLPSLKRVQDDEMVEVDFLGVVTFTPSWGDEFLGPLLNKFKDKLVLKNTENLSVQATLYLLEKIYKNKFKVKKEIRKAGVLCEGKNATFINCEGVGPDAGMIDKGENTTSIDSKWRATRRNK